MRLRNIPGADDVIANHPIAIKNEKEQKGKCPSIIKKRQETQIDRIQKERVKKEIENFLNYCGDEQPEIK